MHMESHLKNRIQECRKKGIALTDPAILIVEDDAALKPLWLSVLDRVAPEAQIDWVLTEEAAERAIRNKIAVGELYDLVIADIFLSGKRSGIDLWKRYGKNGCEFIFVSGASPEKITAMLKGERTPIFLHKPIQPEATGNLIATLLGQRTPQ